ncbi:acyltransferase [Kineococcus glutinatus]|uniref:Acyltransferase 3 domain-containing protein n=1 Tax=Kineococcus glutinatus TaxID=1070872 RepID=A0ABP9HMI4_9ACTN
MLPRLTSLRAFAAAAVLIFHLAAWGVVGSLDGPARLGYAGVSFFFVLSGFVLAWGTRPGLPAHTFYRRRFARVWPSHAVALALAAVLPVVSVARSWEAALPNALLLHAWSTDPRITYGMNGVSWSLSCEAFFYASFPPAVPVLRRLGGRARWALATAALVLAVAAAVVGHGYAFASPRALRGIPPGGGGRPGGARRPATSAGGSTWLTSRPAIFTGEASFAFYLVHEMAIVNMRGHVPGGVAGAALITLVAAAAAATLHLFVERPCNKLLRDRARSIALAPPHVA